MKSVLWKNLHKRSFSVESVHANNVNEFIPKNFVHKNIVAEKILDLSNFQHQSDHENSVRSWE